MRCYEGSLSSCLSIIQTNQWFMWALGGQWLWILHTMLEWWITLPRCVVILLPCLLPTLWWYGFVRKWISYMWTLTALSLYIDFLLLPFWNGNVLNHVLSACYMCRNTDMSYLETDAWIGAKDKVLHVNNLEAKSKSHRRVSNMIFNYKR